jgi:hypothetical protein
MNLDSGGGFDIDDLLERELQRRVGSLRGPSPRVDQSVYHAVLATGGKTMSFSTLTAAASTKAAGGLAAAALLVGGGTAAAAAATGSTNPDVWGKTVTAAVATCKGDLKAGQHGIGPCVSAQAKKKGAQERAAHAASAARENEPTGAAALHPTGAPTSHPTGAPSSHPTGAPSGVPAGPPASIPPGSGSGHPTPPVPTPSPR